MRPLPALFISLVLAAACSDDGGGREVSASGASGVLTLPLTTDGSSSAGGSSGGGGEGSTGVTGGAASVGTGDDGGDVTTGGAPKFDLGVTPDGGLPAEPKACVKVDLLFVVDNSGSMKNEQDNLVASFPGFVTEIQDQLADAESLHIGVVSTDAYAGNENPCAKTLGALITKTGGSNSSNQVCGPYASGMRFMDQTDDLASRFACAAQVGTSGASNEKPLEAALRGLGPELNAPGACNDSFVREDALLVLVVITDEEEEGSSGNPQDWYDQLVALKGGIETNIVVLSLIGPANPKCASAAEIAYRIVEFTEKFTYGSIGQICADTYQPFFHDAIGVIDEACDNFVPPG